MKEIYVVFGKELERGKMLPRFQILSEHPAHNHRVYKLELGDCIDAAEIHFGDESMEWIKIDLYRISNIDDEPETQFLESYTMKYVR
jgi:hypothetical protein